MRQRASKPRADVGLLIDLFWTVNRQLTSSCHFLSDAVNAARPNSLNVGESQQPVRPIHSHRPVLLGRRVKRRVGTIVAGKQA